MIHSYLFEKNGKVRIDIKFDGTYSVAGVFYYTDKWQSVSKLASIERLENGTPILETFHKFISKQDVLKAIDSAYESMRPCEKNIEI